MKDYLILKSACRKVYVAGGGNFWFEKGVVGNDETLVYRLYTIISFFIYLSMTVLEITAVFVGNFPDVEKSDAITFALSHTIVMGKMLSVIFRKKIVKELFRDLVNVCSQYENDKKMAAKSKVINLNIYANHILVFGACVTYVFEGLRKVYYEDTHFITVVTYWPSFENNTAPAIAFRILCTIILYIMMVPMIGFDCLTLTILIIIKYKFITLRNYFEGLREEFDRIEKLESNKKASETMWNRIVEGIEMHRELLRITKMTDKSFGFLLAMQVCLGFASDVSLLLQLALTENLSVTSALKIMLFIIALLFLLALFLCNAGEITYQASLLADSVFYCGWHDCLGGSPRRDAGRLVLFTCAVAQKPLVMKAFSMLHLTYGTFLTVVRSMYSVFTLILSRHKSDINQSVML